MKKKVLLPFGILICLGLTSCQLGQKTVKPSSSIVESSKKENENKQTQNNTSKPASSSTTKPTAISPTSTEPSVNPSAAETTLDILEINDLHGYAYQSSRSTSNFSKINLASYAYYINEIRAQEEYDNVVLVANGDLFQGTAFSNLTHGKSIINAMNGMGFDMMGIGNHEFDWGLEEIIQYFDYNEENGEANFPLLNGNVNYTTTNTLGKKGDTVLGKDDDSLNITPYTIVEKSGVKVALLSYIGPQTDSINQNKLKNFYLNCQSTTDKNFMNIVKQDCLEVKQKGADVVLINIHEGTTDGVENNAINTSIANLQDDNGKYLVDALINGHTHYTQSGSIARAGYNPLPIVQAGANGDLIGHIKLTIDPKNKTVKSVDSVNYEYLDEVVGTTNKDAKVDAILEKEFQEIKPQIEEVFCVNTVYAKKQYLGKWTVNLMKKYSDADVAIINTGGIRSTMDATNITVEELYKVNPFDNCLMYVEAKGSEIKSFYSSNSSYYYFNEDFDSSKLEDDTIYKVMTIDYVYYSSYWKNVFKTATLKFEDTNNFARTLMIEDCKQHASTGLNLSTAAGRTALLASKGWK